VSIRKLRKQVLAKEMVITVGELKAASEFQRKRLLLATGAAQLYLEGLSSQEVAVALDRGLRRTAQIIQAGAQYMVREGWLRPGAISARTHDAESTTTSERDQGPC
jgi:hypothetical protein